MRVIAGAAKGRRLAAPPGERTRPTSDRVKEALFARLQPRLLGAAVVDLYAGSGALGIEALSRGAAHATFVERDRRAVAAVHANLAATGLAGRAAMVVAALPAALRQPLPGGPFDLALLDPPYPTTPAEVAAVLDLLAPQLRPDALVSVELSARGQPPRWPAGMLPAGPRRYGDTVLYSATTARAAGPEETTSP